MAAAMETMAMEMIMAVAADSVSHSPIAMLLCLYQAVPYMGGLCHPFRVYCAKQHTQYMCDAGKRDGYPVVA